MILNKRTNVFKDYKKSLTLIGWVDYLLTGLLGFCFYSIFLWIDFYLNEVQYVMIKLSSGAKSFMLASLLILANLIPLKKIFRNLAAVFLLGVFLILNVALLPVYFDEVEARKFSPKIYEISKKSFFQSEELMIKGQNFGPLFKKGQVVANEVDFTVKDWADSLILVEVPVPPHFGPYDLKIITWEGLESNKIRVFFRDPEELNDYQ